MGYYSAFPLLFSSSSSPPGDVLFEGFESLDGSGIPTMQSWSLSSFGTPIQTREQSTSHVTEGTYSWKVSDATAVSGGASINLFGANLTGYSHLLLDVYVETATTGGCSLYVANGDFSIDTNPFTTGTGSFTLDADLSVFSGDLSNMFINIAPYGTVPHTIVFYADNMRLTT